MVSWPRNYLLNFPMGSAAMDGLLRRPSSRSRRPAAHKDFVVPSVAKVPLSACGSTRLPSCSERFGLQASDPAAAFVQVTDFIARTMRHRLLAYARGTLRAPRHNGVTLLGSSGDVIAADEGRCAHCFPAC